MGREEREREKVMKEKVIGKGKKGATCGIFKMDHKKVSNFKR